LGIYLSINSNGSLITKEVRQELLKNPPVRINISLYGASDDTYRKMCGQAAFDQVVENIIALKEAGIDVRLNHSITPYNRQDLQQIYEISKELDLHVKTASYMYPPVRLKDGQFGCGNRLSAEEAARSSVEWDLLRLDEGEFMERAEGIAKLCAVDRSECAVEMDDGIGCRTGRSCFWLTWEGKMLPCGMMPGTGADPLKDGFAAAWQKTMDDTKQIHRPKECLQCPKKDICSVCAAVCVTETGAFDCVPDYVCRQTDAFIEITRQEYEKRKG
jgi:radical SAM protein with 4Fe4S-binding SPASM domain